MITSKKRIKIKRIRKKRKGYSVSGVFSHSKSACVRAVSQLCRSLALPFTMSRHRQHGLRYIYIYIYIYKEEKEDERMTGAVIGAGSQPRKETGGKKLEKRKRKRGIKVESFAAIKDRIVCAVVRAKLESVYRERVRVPDIHTWRPT